MVASFISFFSCALCCCLMLYDPQLGETRKTIKIGFQSPSWKVGHDVAVQEMDFFERVILYNCLFSNGLKNGQEVVPDFGFKNQVFQNPVKCLVL